MNIPTTQTVTASTTLTDDEIIAQLKTEAQTLAADPPVAPLDVVDVSDPALVGRFRMLKTFGVVVNVNTVNQNAAIVLVTYDGKPLTVILRFDQFTKRAAA